MAWPTLIVKYQEAVDRSHPPNQRNLMPQTINKTANLQIIAGVFSDHENSEKATAAFQEEAGVLLQNIQVLFQSDEDAAANYRNDLEDRGVASTQAVYYDEAIRNGKVFVAI